MQERILEELKADAFGKAVWSQEALLKTLPLTHWSERTMAKYLLALTYQEIHETASAFPLWDEVIGELKGVDEPWMLSEMVFHAGLAHASMHDSTRARGLFDEGLALAKAKGLKAWESSFQHELGRLALDGDAVRAVTHFSLALDLRRDLNDKSLIASSAYHLGRAHHKLNDFVKARDLYEQALMLVRDDEELASEKRGIEEHLSEIRNAELKGKLASLKF